MDCSCTNACMYERKSLKKIRTRITKTTSAYLMKYNEVTENIIALIKAASSFSESGQKIEELLSKCADEDLLDHLDYGGVIPERFDHDSSEEKLFAKYCDALFARALRALGLESRVLDSRGESADVIAHCGSRYSLVGDAKAFRLSRTAKNQKDFKVEALNQWRGDHTYACLLAPLYQYPNTESQVYKQAVRYNVTLLSYTHLAFMIRTDRQIDSKALEVLWNRPGNLRESGSARDYWAAINGIIAKLTGLTDREWQQAVANSDTRLREQAASEIRYWEQTKEDLKQLDQKKAVECLIKALKIDSKIGVIRRTGGLFSTRQARSVKLDLK